MPAPMLEASPSKRLRRTAWAVLAFLLAFSVLIAVIVRFYLVPAADAARFADETGKRQLSAISTLLLAVVLFTALVGLGMVFRIGRFFFPRPAPHRVVTEHIDAWSESARRLSVKSDPDADADRNDDDGKDDGRRSGSV